MSIELIIGIITFIIAIITAIIKSVFWIIETTRAFTKQLTTILDHIDYLRKSDSEVADAIKNIEALNSSQATEIKSLIIKTENMDYILEETQLQVFEILNKLRMKPRARGMKRSL
jgi:hypothetical protein